MKKKKNNIINANKVGTITPEERDEIKRLYERKNALVELFKTLSDVDKEETAKLYHKIVEDMTETSAQYHKWFETNSQKYNWKNIPGYQWNVNFETCEVFLQK
jgi:CXXX repeat modification system protein